MRTVKLIDLDTKDEYVISLVLRVYYDTDLKSVSVRHINNKSEVTTVYDNHLIVAVY